ncbi:MAG TPA: RHS repeat-associated core domain-containing protein [Thermoanaerobaculia bacterium]|nr:RHS repeat-associated core domain-containing protein [Thermoanaerobaculia bacterium]
MIRRILLAVALLILTVSFMIAPPLYAAGNISQYIVVLRVDGPDPDEAKLGGHIDYRKGKTMVVSIPDAAYEAWRKHPGVKYLQLAVTGPGPRRTTPSNAGPALTAEGQVNRGTNATPPTWDSGAYSYDGSGNIYSIGPNGDGITSYYQYDSLLRLRRAEVGTRTETWDYDGFGNITNIWNSTTNTTIQLPVDSATNKFSGVQYAYDAGSLTEDGTFHYRYDPFDMMTERWSGGADDQVYVYTASDERIGVRNSAAGKWIWSIRDEGGRALREYEEWADLPTWPWIWIRDHVYRGDKLLGAQRVVEEGGQMHVHLDHLGTPRLTTGPLGGLIAQNDYAPFGAELSSPAQLQARGYDREEPFKFTGHERDSTSNFSSNTQYFDYMHARYYSSAWGRFLSVDPNLDVDEAMHEPQMWNRYAYVGNNPLKYTDPNGRERLQLYHFGLQPRQETPAQAAWSGAKMALMAGGILFGGGAVLDAGGSFLARQFGLLQLARAIGIEATAGISTATLTRLAQSGGPTVELVTNLTQAPQAGRGLSAAAGEGAQALANAARSGEGVKTFAGQVPQALLKALEQAKLLTVSVTEMKGVRQIEYRFDPRAAQYITQFFKDVTDKINK